MRQRNFGGDSSFYIVVEGVVSVTQARHSKAVQAEPMKSKLKAPGTERLKLKHDNLLSRFAFNFNLRRYNTAARRRLPRRARRTQRTNGRARTTKTRSGRWAPGITSVRYRCYTTRRARRLCGRRPAARACSSSAANISYW